MGTTGGADLPPLHAAARDGDLHAVRSLLKRIDVMSRDPWGETPLHWASNAKVADCLIAAGALVRRSRPDGRPRPPSVCRGVCPAARGKLTRCHKTDEYG
jgi:hypothetical protein